MKIKQYKTVIADDVNSLDSEVNSLITSWTKWQPFGSPYSISSTKVCQAMVEYEDED